MKDTETEVLKSEDPRYFSIGPFGTGSACIATTATISGRVVGFGIPSAPSLFMNLAHNCWMQAKSIDTNMAFIDHPYPQGTYAEGHKELFDYFENMIAQIVLAYLALEAFANSRIPEDFVIPESAIKPSSTRILTRNDIERELQLKHKLNKILPKIEGVTPLLANQKLWTSFNNLKALRNRVVHLKCDDMRSSKSAVRTIWSDLLILGSNDYCSTSYNIMMHYLKDKTIPRWLALYPYSMNIQRPSSV